MNMGLRNGGGLADSMEPYVYGEDSKFPLKLVFDLSYFIFINTIILNIVFGVIIDTFGDMRDEAFRRQEILDNTCLVCLNQKQDMESEGFYFGNHVRVLHRIWDYVDYVVYLRSKNKADLSYVEEEALKSYQKKSAEWLPVKDSLYLSNEDEDQKQEEVTVD